mgnify:CR=1 FL=1
MMCSRLHQEIEGGELLSSEHAAFWQKEKGGDWLAQEGSKVEYDSHVMVMKVFRVRPQELNRGYSLEVGAGFEHGPRKADLSGSQTPLDASIKMTKQSTCLIERD